MTWVCVLGARVDLGQIVMARFFFFFFARLFGGFGLLCWAEVLHLGTLPYLRTRRTPRARCVDGEILLLLKSLNSLIWLTCRWRYLHLPLFLVFLSSHTNSMGGGGE